jgi:hypothetical protein
MALVFRANLTGTADGAVTGTVAPDTVYNKPGAAALKFTSVGGAGNSYITYDLGSAKGTLLVRLRIEADLGNTSVSGVPIVKFLAADGTTAVTEVDVFNNTTICYHKLNSGGFVNSNIGGASYLFAADRGTAEEWWIAYKADASAGYHAFGGSGGAWRGSAALANDTKTVRYIRVGMGSGSPTGSIYLHELSVWDAIPTGLDEIFGMAGKAQYQGCPAVIDVADTTGKTVSAVQLSSDGGATWGDTLGGLTQVDGTKSTTSLTTSSWAHDSFNADDGTYDGCLLWWTAGQACEFIPPALILRQTGNVARFVELRPPMQSAVQYTFSFRRWLDLGDGTYRVGLGGAHLPTVGPWKVRLTFSDESTAEASFDVQARGRGQASRRHDGGKHLCLGGDDGTIDQIAVYRNCFAARSVRPYLTIVPGRAGAAGYLTWRWARELAQYGVAFSCHGLDHENLTTLTPEAGAIVLDQAKQCELVEGFNSAVYNAPWGIFAYTGSVDAKPDMRQHWAILRSATAGTYNGLPVNATFFESAGAGVFKCNFELLNNLAGADDAEKAATMLAGDLHLAGANALANIGFHLIGTAATSTTVGLLNTFIDAAVAAGWKLTSYREFLGARAV